MKKMGGDLRAGMDVGPGALVGVFREHAGEQRYAELVHDVGDALERDHEDTRVGQDDLLGAAGGRIAEVGGRDVGLDDLADVRQAPQASRCL